MNQYEDDEETGYCCRCNEYCMGTMTVVSSFGFCGTCYRDINLTAGLLLGIIRQQLDDLNDLRNEIEEIRRILDHNDVTSEGLI